MEITEKAPAKLNLFLDTPFNHPDGLPEWNMIMTSVDLADYVKIESIPGRTGIKVRTNTGFLPNDSRNLAYQAARVLQEKYQIRARVNIEIRKHIPVAAGLGGGSSDAAAVLRGLNQLWDLKLNNEELAKIGLAIDSDVPFCVYGHTAHVLGKGEKVIPLKKLPPMWVVIAKPKLSVSTPHIISKIEHQTLQHSNIKLMLDAIEHEDYDSICRYMGNVLEQVTGKEHPEVLKIKDKIKQFGADAAQMSGTGPTVFGICSKSTRAKHIVNSLKGFCHEVYLVRILWGIEMANHEATKKKIVDGLFELLKDNELASISVSNICQTASVSRMSYYRSFKSKDQIIDYKIDQIFTEFFNYLMTRPNHDISAFLEAYFAVCRKNAYYIGILIDADLNDRLYNKLHFYLTDLIEKGIFKLRTDIPVMWVNFAAGGLSQMVVQWVKDGLVQTNQEMVMVAHRFLR